MFHNGLEEWITEAVVLALGEAILFLRWRLLKEGLPHGDARDVGFCLGSLVNWARRESQVEMRVNTIQEGHQAIADAVVERITKARWPGCPQGTLKSKWNPTAAYNIEEWIQGLEKMLPKWRWERTMQVIMKLSGWMFIHNVCLEVEDRVEDKGWHNCQEILLVDLLL